MKIEELESLCEKEYQEILAQLSGTIVRKMGAAMLNLLKGKEGKGGAMLNLIKGTKDKAKEKENDDTGKKDLSSLSKIELNFLKDKINDLKKQKNYHPVHIINFFRSKVSFFGVYLLHDKAD